MRIASAAARFHPGYSRAGTSPDGGLSWTLLQAIGHERAMRFLLEGEMIDAQTALTLGLVGELVKEEGFAARFSSYCQQLAVRLTDNVPALDSMVEHPAPDQVSRGSGLSVYLVIGVFEVPVGLAETLFPQPEFLQFLVGGVREFGDEVHVARHEVVRRVLVDELGDVLVARG